MNRIMELLEEDDLFIQIRGIDSFEKFLKILQNFKNEQEIGVLVKSSEKLEEIIKEQLKVGWLFYAVANSSIEIALDN